MSRAALAAGFPALGTTATVLTVEATADDEARAAVVREIAEIDRACSRFRDDSELVDLNADLGSAGRGLGHVVRRRSTTRCGPHA